MKKIKSVLLIMLLFPLISSGQVLKVEKISVEADLYDVEKEELIQEKDFDLGELLFKNYPQINTVRKGIFVNEIFFRGFGRKNINILIDGTRVYGACPNGMDPPSFFIRPFEIEGISINSVDIKSQGSLGGAINIITKKPEEGKNFLNFNIVAGDFDYSYTDLQLNLSNFWIGSGFIYSKPYETGEGKKVTQYPQGMSAYQDRYKDKKAIDLKHTTLKLKHKNTTFTASVFDADTVLYPYLMMDSIKDENIRLGINYNLKKDINIDLYYSQMKHYMSDRYRVSAVPWTDGSRSTRGYMMQTLASSKVYGTNISKNLNNFDIGIELFNREWKADNQIMMIDNSGMIPDVRSFNFGIFAIYSKKIKDIKIKTGVRFDYVRSSADFSIMKDNRDLFFRYYGEEKNKSEYNYFSGIIEGNKTISKKRSISITVSHSVRFPDPQELFISLKRPMSKPDWIGNPYLKPTKNRQVELKFVNKYSAGKVNLTVFYSDLKDYIYLHKITTPATAISYTNIDAYMYGGTIDGFFVLNENFSISAGLSYQRGKKKEGVDKDLAEIPPLKAMISLIYERENISFEIQDIYSLKQENVDSTLNETPTDSWNVVNLRFSYIKSGLNLTLGIDNLFDEFYYQYLSFLRNPFSAGTKVPEPGRFMYIKVGVNI